MSLRLASRPARYTPLPMELAWPVLCGVIDCGTRLGLVVDPLAPRLRLAPGYRRDGDGVFRLTPHALSRLRRGLMPRRRGRGWSPTDEYRNEKRSTVLWTEPCCLPFLIKCPSCGMVQEGTSVALRVTREHPAGLDHHRDTTVAPHDYTGVV